MWANYKKTWSSVNKRLTSARKKQSDHLIIENTAVVSYSRLWQNEVMFHAHSVYNRFLDSRMRWPTPVSLEKFARHWRFVITHSDINWKSCLLIYSNLEIVVQKQGKSTSHVLWKIFAALELGGWKTFDPVVRVDASWLKQWCEIGPLFDVAEYTWIMQKNWYIDLPWQPSLMHVVLISPVQHH